MKPVLLVFDEAQRIEAVVAPRFPGVEFVLVNAPAEVVPALEKHRPEVVFSLKHSGFDGPAHRPIVDYPSVKWVQVAGSGYEHFVPWDASRLTLTNSVGVSSRYLAETATGAMLALNGGFLRYLEQQRAREWRGWSFRPLCEQTILIVGLGAIGGYMASNAKALGMRVLGVRASDAPHPDVDEMHGPQALMELLRQTDVVSLHLRLSDDTHHLIDAAALSAMRRGALLLNTARGPVVDESALIDALQIGHLGGAYLDVFETEPLPAQSPLWSMPNVLITPHASDNIADYPEKFAAFFADNLECWMQGNTMQNVLRP